MRKKLELFLRAHSHLLVVVGALIVFLTFVIKEGVGEHWRGTAEAIETAEYFYPLLTQTAEIKKEVKKVEDQQRKTADPASANLLTHFSLFKIDTDVLSDELNHLNDLEMSAANRRVLIDVLPGGGSLRQEADRVDLQLAQISKTLNFVDQERAQVIYKEILAEHGHPLNKDQRAAEYDKSEPHIGAEVEESLKALASTSLASSTLSENVLEHARVIRTRNAQYSIVSWWMSAFLFALGWTIGLVGKLYGVSGAAEE